jgi:hypothetical protein
MTLTLLIGLIFMAGICDSKNQMDSSIKQKPPLMCFNEIYRIPIMSTRSFRITLNRTLLVQREVVSIHLLAKIANRKVLQFDNGKDVIMTKIDLINNTLRKFQ